MKLSTIDTTDQQYRVKLWKMFIEQTVRETLPPRQTSEVSEEALEHDRREYFQQPSRKVLEAINPQIPDFSEKSGISQRAIILGDPGAGKSLLIIEVVSPGSEGAERDYENKRQEYEALQVPEYWMVDPVAMRVTVYLLEDKRYQAQEYVGDPLIQSLLFPALALTTQQVLQS